jgi:hypothetical protein
MIPAPAANLLFVSQYSLFTAIPSSSLQSKFELIGILVLPYSHLLDLGPRKSQRPPRWTWRGRRDYRFEDSINAFQRVFYSFSRRWTSSYRASQGRRPRKVCYGETGMGSSRTRSKEFHDNDLSVLPSANPGVHLIHNRLLSRLRRIVYDSRNKPSRTERTELRLDPPLALR